MATTATATAPAKPDAIIYLPGFFKLAAGGTTNIPNRIRSALDRSAANHKATFSTRTNVEATEAVKGLATVTTILRNDGAGDTPIIDVYEFEYRDVLVGSTVARKPITQAAKLGSTLLGLSGRVIAGLSRPSKSPAEKRHALYGVVIFLGLAAYMVFLLVAGLAALVDTGAAIPWLRSSQLPEGAHRALDYVKTGVMAFTTLGLFTAKGIRELLDTASVEFSAAGAYINTGDRVKTVQGNLGDLLQRIQEHGTDYDRIHVVAFSFGSLLAIDSIFPKQPTGTHWSSIHSLVTIGCPFDFIRTYWPEYFGSRNGPSKGPEAWYNVFAPADILGSDFTDAEYGDMRGRVIKAVVPTGIKLRQGIERIPEAISFGDDRPLSRLSVVDWFRFAGFRAHSSYWDPSENSASCFSPIVERLYRNRYALS